MMWCMTTRTTCSDADRVSRWRRKSGPVLQVEGEADQFGQPGRDGVGIEGRRVLDEEPPLLPGREVFRIGDAEDGRLVDGGERAPERLVAVEDAAEGPPERVEIERGADPAGAGDVIGGPARRELVGIPEHLLAVRGPRHGRLSSRSRVRSGRGRRTGYRHPGVGEMLARPLGDAEDRSLPRSGPRRGASRRGGRRCRTSAPWRRSSRAPSPAAADRARPVRAARPRSPAVRSRRNSTMSASGSSAALGAWCLPFAAT